jgi:hypothetical protein
MVAEHERTFAAISPPSTSEANAAHLGALFVEFQLIHSGRFGGSGGPTRTNPPGAALPSGGSGHHHDAQGRAHPARIGTPKKGKEFKFMGRRKKYMRAT